MKNNGWAKSIKAYPRPVVYVGMWAMRPPICQNSMIKALKESK